MTELNMRQAAELQPEIGSLEDQRLLREEIERQLEVEREAGRAMAQDTLERQERMRQSAARALRQEEETRQRQTSATTAKHTRKTRPYGLDALLLCAVTLGMGAFLGPIVHPAPVVTTPVALPVNWSPMPVGGLAGHTYTIGQNSTDFSGMNWKGTRFTVDQEFALGDGREYVQGHYDWNTGGDYIGTEQVSGPYDSATGQLDVTGSEVIQPNTASGVNLCRGHYTSTMTADGQLVNGFMEGAPGIRGVNGYFNSGNTP